MGIPPPPAAAAAFLLFLAGGSDAATAAFLLFFGIGGTLRVWRVRAEVPRWPYLPQQ